MEEECRRTGVGMEVSWVSGAQSSAISACSASLDICVCVCVCAIHEVLMILSLYSRSIEQKDEPSLWAFPKKQKNTQERATLNHRTVNAKDRPAPLMCTTPTCRMMDTYDKPYFLARSPMKTEYEHTTGHTHVHNTHVHNNGLQDDGHKRYAMISSTLPP